MFKMVTSGIKVKKKKKEEEEEEENIISRVKHILGGAQRFFKNLSLVPNPFWGFSSQLKGTNGRQKTYDISHVYSIFYSGFMFQTTVIFGITKDGSLY